MSLVSEDDLVFRKVDDSAHEETLACCDLSYSRLCSKKTTGASAPTHPAACPSGQTIEEPDAAIHRGVNRALRGGKGRKPAEWILLPEYSYKNIPRRRDQGTDKIPMK